MINMCLYTFFLNIELDCKEGVNKPYKSLEEFNIILYHFLNCLGSILVFKTNIKAIISKIAPIQYGALGLM